MIEKNKFRTKKHILLTGSGFTKNFGGYLGEEMWAQIFNRPRIQKNPKLRCLLLDGNYDYESIYSQVLSDSDYTENDREDFTIALSEAYKKLDDIVRGATPFRTEPHIGLCSLQEQLLDKFIGENNERGFVFTLNQDLFIERNQSSPRIFVCPGVNYRDQLHISPRRESELRMEDVIQLPSCISDADKETFLQSSFSFFIKLHGSFNWRGPDGKSLTITGLDKIKDIRTVPLLSWYFSLFEQVLRDGEKRLLIIGYGFRDAHINNVIGNAILDGGLKIFIVDPQPMSKIEKIIAAQPSSILGLAFKRKKGLAGYFQTTVADMCTLLPTRLERTPSMRDIEECFFGS